MNRPFDLTIDLSARGTYVSTVMPLEGDVRVVVRPNDIVASIVNSDEWFWRRVRELPPGSSTDPLSLFRPWSPGKLIHDEHFGAIQTDANWKCERVLVRGREGSRPTRSDDTYSFGVTRVCIDGPAAGDTIAAVRRIYRRGEFSAVNSFRGHTIIARSLATAEDDLEKEVLAITFDWNASEIEADAVWHAANLFLGNTLQHVACEYFNEAGELIETRYELGSVNKDDRRLFFHHMFDMYGRMARNGWGTIAEGIYRLLSKDFPIDVVLHHLHEATGSPYDIEAQHLVLAIHTAIEGWNRLWGRQNWMDDSEWEKIERKIRRPMKEDEAYKNLSPELQDNVRCAVQCANDTTTAWRQAQLFRRLNIDISDRDSKRALNLRNHLLHNGYFVRRYHALSPEERQQRVDDIERLRRFTLLIVLKLVSYVGDFWDPTTFFAAHVEADADLPDEIQPVKA